MKVCGEKKILWNEVVNNTKTISYPFVGFLSYKGNTIEWNVVDIKKQSVVLALPFFNEKAGNKPYLNTFAWDSKGNTVVFASTFLDRFKIVRISKDCRSVESDVTVVCNDNIPKESKCFYTAAGCGKFIYLLSQKGIKTMKSGESSDKGDKTKCDNYGKGRKDRKAFIYRGFSDFPI